MIDTYNYFIILIHKLSYSYIYCSIAYVISLYQIIVFSVFFNLQGV